MRKARTAPRKLPTQARARATVDAIVDATARVLVKDGWDRASTNRVAETAGVSVGSLYQYFPSKESLVLAVMERHQERILERLEKELIESAAAGVEVVTRRLIRSMLEIHEVDPRLHRVLLEQVPRVDQGKSICALRERLGLLVTAYLESRASELAVDDPQLAAWVLITAVEGLTHGMLLDKPEFLGGEALEEQINLLVLRFIGARAGRTRSRARRSVAVRAEARA
jgi:AcrR family transcriptional regulator